MHIAISIPAAAELCGVGEPAIRRAFREGRIDPAFFWHVGRQQTAVYLNLGSVVGCYGVDEAAVQANINRYAANAPVIQTPGRREVGHPRLDAADDVPGRGEVMTEPATATATDPVPLAPFNPGEAFNAAPATTTTAVVPVDVEALERLTDDERVDALCKAWGQWRRLETVAAWSFGRALRAIRPAYPRNKWGAILDRIGIEHSKARRLMRLADVDNAEIARYSTVSAAIKSLGPVRPKDEPPAEPAPASTPPPASTEGRGKKAVVANNGLSPAAIVEEVAAEDDSTPPPPVKSDPDRGWKLYRETLLDSNAKTRRIQVLERRLRDVHNAVLVAKPCACGSGAVHDADVLVDFFGTQRKGAA